MDDQAILDLLWNRAETAIKFLSEKFGKRLMATAMNILNNRSDAEESVNDTYFAVWNQIPPQRPDPLSGYVYKIGRNIALDKFKYNVAGKRSSKYEISIDELADILPSNALEDQIDARLLGESINRYLGSIQKENRIIFLKRYWFGDDIKEIAHHMGLRSNTVSVRLNRIRTGLRSHLIKEGFFNE